MEETLMNPTKHKMAILHNVKITADLLNIVVMTNHPNVLNWNTVCEQKRVTGN